MKFTKKSNTISTARWCAVVALSATLVACGGGTAGDDDIDPNGVPLIGGEDEFDNDEFDNMDNVDNVDNGNNTADDGCDSLAGTDLDSSTADWDDNCRLQTGGTHQRSSYTQGVQRIVWCRGFQAGVNDILAFSDGDYGPNTTEQVRLFQEAQGISADGIVARETWGELQDTLEVLDNSAVDRDTNGVVSTECDGVSLFYQTREATGALTGWTMAVTPGSRDAVPFSVDPVQ